MNWDDKLPDTSMWQPREDAAGRLANLFLKRCRQIEQRILVRAAAEKEAMIDNYDAGPGVEDIFREELSQLLPTRYTVRCGTINDRYGRTAGDCDVVIFNEHWFPFIKTGASELSRKLHFPIESVYSAIEIKSSLNFNTLDEAMRKLVTVHRLHRPVTPGNRITENRWVSGCPHSVSNPLYSAIIAVGLSPGTRFEDIVNRFYTICKSLERHNVIRSLCVLGEGCVTWAFKEGSESKSATFTCDYDKHIYPVFHHKDSLGCAFYPVANDLLSSLCRSLLAPEELQLKYGLNNYTVSIPCNDDISLPPSKPPRTKDPEDPYDF